MNLYRRDAQHLSFLRYRQREGKHDRGKTFCYFPGRKKKIYQMNAQGLSKASDVLDILQIPYDEVAIYLINGRHSKLGDKIQDGDVLAIFPPVGGG